MGAYASLENNAVVRHGYGASAFGGGALNGASVDTQGFNEALVILATGLCGAGTLDVKIQDSADNSSFADVAGAAFAQIVNANDSVVRIARLKLDGNLVRRYIRVTSTVATATMEHTVTFVLSGNQYAPQDANTVVFTV